MIKFGDKYMLTKDYSGIRSGAVFEVIGINVGDGTVTMQSVGLITCNGIEMSGGLVVDSEALNKLFIPYIKIKIKKKSKRKFSDWTDVDYSKYNPFEKITNDMIANSLADYMCMGRMFFRYDGKKTEVKIFDQDMKEYYRSHATCKEGDKFDLNIGICISACRALKKMIEAEAKRMY